MEHRAEALEAGSAVASSNSAVLIHKNILCLIPKHGQSSSPAASCCFLPEHRSCTLQGRRAAGASQAAEDDAAAARGRGLGCCCCCCCFASLAAPRDTILS